MCWTKWINAPDVAVVAVADVVGVVFVVFAATAVDWSQFLSISLKIKKKKIVSEQKKKTTKCSIKQQFQWWWLFWLKDTKQQMISDRELESVTATQII